MNPNKLETREEIRDSWKDPNITTIYVRKSWKAFFDTQFESLYFKEQMKMLTKDILTNTHRLVFPSKNKIFTAFNLCSLRKVKVVIIGQDVYHSKINEAQGLCFSVPPGIAIPKSLQNIFKELERDPHVSFTFPEHGCLMSWAQQGVLLLNSSLTVYEKSPGSHMNYYKQFTDNIIKHISLSKENVVFMLWGAYAKSKLEFIDHKKHCVLTSPHPSPLTRGFIGNSHFSLANAYLKKHDISEIKWQI